MGDGPRPSTAPALRAVVGTDTADAPRLEIVVECENEASVERRVVCESELVRIGSHAANDVVLDDLLVSRFHCALRRDPSSGRWRLEDTGSLNGTCLGGVWVRDADLPFPEARIEIGASRVRARVLSSTHRVPLVPHASFGSLQGRSEAMRRLFAMIERVAVTDASVLIEGESGTGKELVATEIVRRGPRADGPFVVVDCGAIAPTLIESTLFGHRRGAFTGADRDHVGAFESAEGGTVFLDEIGEMPLDMQPKLLRVIESRSVARVGENQRRAIDVRIVAATNRRLEREINCGRFREDLYYRLSVVALRVPPLRERLEDLELLVSVLLDAMDAPAPARAVFTREHLAEMAKHEWPGNVRELRNYVERAIVLDLAASVAELPRPSLSPASVGASAPSAAASGLPATVTATVDLDVPLRAAKADVVARFEKQYIAALLARTGGNVSAAARHTGMDRINLHRLIQRYGLKAARSVKD